MVSAISRPAPIADVIIPTYNNIDELRACLAGMERQTVRNIRLIICVDGSTDGTFEFLETLSLPFPTLVLAHPNRANCGRNAARNLALPYCNAEYLLMIDSDIVPLESWVEYHLECLRAHDCISLGEVLFSNADTNMWAAYLRTRGRSKYRPGDSIPYQYLMTGNLGMRTKYFLAVGGQDPAMRGYGGGDTELAIRLHKAFHLPTIYNPSALGCSKMLKSLEFALGQMKQFGRENLRYITAKHPDFTDGYGLALYAGTAPLSWFVRFLLAPPPVAVAERLLVFAPTWLRNHLLNYVVLGRICDGFVSAEKHAARDATAYRAPDDNHLIAS